MTTPFMTTEELKEAVQVGQVWKRPDGKQVEIKKVYYDGWECGWCAEFVGGTAWAKLQNIVDRCEKAS